jgi:hypothetical protein
MERELKEREHADDTLEVDMWVYWKSFRPKGHIVTSSRAQK